jgi:hypothetical protein
MTLSFCSVNDRSPARWPGFRFLVSDFSLAGWKKYHANYLDAVPFSLCGESTISGSSCAA